MNKISLKSKINNTDRNSIAPLSGLRILDMCRGQEKAEVCGLYLDHHQPGQPSYAKWFCPTGGLLAGYCACNERCELINILIMREVNFPQRLAVSMQRGNAASALGTCSIPDDRQVYYAYI